MNDRNGILMFILLSLVLGTAWAQDNNTTPPPAAPQDSGQQPEIPPPPAFGQENPAPPVSE